MNKFKINSKYKPSGDQPGAIKELCLGLEKNLSDQVLLGVTGSGKHLLWLISFRLYNDPH